MARLFLTRLLRAGLRRIVPPAVPGSGRAVLIAFCAAHPINPLCCPTPCPVIDPARVAEAAGEARQIWQSVDQCRQIANSYLTLAASFGPNGPLATELRRVPGNVSKIMTTVRAAAPGMMKEGDLSNPRAVAEMLKTSLLDPGKLPVNQLTGQVSRVGERAGTWAANCLDAFAGGLSAETWLSEVSRDGSRQADKAQQARDARSDFAGNANARQAVSETLTAVTLLLSRWASMEAASGAVRHAVAADPLPHTTRSAQSSPMAISASAAASRQADRLRIRSAVQDMDATVSEIARLHNQRHAAGVMAAQYPGLRTTIASADKALEFREIDARAAVDALSGLFLDGAQAFSAARQRLSDLDRTGWRDSGTKTAAAAEASATVATLILAEPGLFGTVRDPAGPPPAAGPQAAALAQELAARFAAWLESDKQVRFWEPLRQGAQSAVARLDQRIGDVNARFGMDVRSVDAAGEEQRLIDRFATLSRTYDSLDHAAPGDTGHADIEAVVTRLRDVARVAAADSSASRFLSMWGNQ